jgi:hypothetical protein
VSRRDLPALWLPLLERLTERYPSWGLWKNADDALGGRGDFDSTAPERDWDGITAEFADWAARHGFGPVTGCREVRGVLFLVALDPGSGTFFELDVNARKYWRGWTLFRPHDLARVMEIDERGFRRVRRGAEGVILLVQNGLRWGGRPNEEGLRRKNVREALAADPEGVRYTCELFGRAAGAIARAADAVVRGEWDRRALLTAEGWALARALQEPQIALSRVEAKLVKKRCPLLQAIFNDRKLPADEDAWLRAVARTHPVIDRRASVHASGGEGPRAAARGDEE